MPKTQIAPAAPIMLTNMDDIQNEVCARLRDAGFGASKWGMHKGPGKPPAQYRVLVFDKDGSGRPNREELGFISFTADGHPSVHTIVESARDTIREAIESRQPKAASE